MTVTNIWLTEGRIMLTELAGQVTTEDLVAGANRGTQMIASGIAPVYGLVNMSHLDRFPIKLTELKRLFEIETSDKLAYIVIYGIPNRMVNFLVSTFAQLVRTRYKIFATCDEALAFIEMMESRDAA